MTFDERIEHLKVGDIVKYRRGFYMGTGEIVHIREGEVRFDTLSYLLITDQRIEKKVPVPKEIAKKYNPDRKYSWFPVGCLEIEEDEEVKERFKNRGKKKRYY